MEDRVSKRRKYIENAKVISSSKVLTPLQEKCIDFVFEDAKDITFICEKKHRVRTTVFWPFRNEGNTPIHTAYTEEATGRVIKVPDISPHALSGVTRWIFTGEHGFLTVKFFQPGYSDRSAQQAARATKMMEFLEMMGLDELRSKFAQTLLEYIKAIWSTKDCRESANRISRFSVNLLYGYVCRSLAEDIVFEELLRLFSVGFFLFKRVMTDEIKTCFKDHGILGRLLEANPEACD
jgi:hypothetical protein